MQCGIRLRASDELLEPLGRERAAQLGHPQAQQVHRRDLGDERLGRGDRDLEPGAGEQHAVRVARGLRAHPVGEGEDGGAALAGEPHGGERVGRLAGLRDADHQVAGPDHGVAVAVLAGDVHLDADARPLLDRVAADQAGVVRGAAGDDDDAPGVAEHLVVDHPEVVEVDAVAAGGAVGDRLRDGVGLLVDLLEHERLVAALLGGLRAPVDLLDRALDRRAVGAREAHVVGGDGDDLVVLDQLDVARVGQEGGDGRAEELLAVAAAHDQRALLAGGDDDARLVGGDGDEGVVAAQLGVGAPDGLLEPVAVEMARDEMGDDLGVGLRGEHRAVVDELLLELHVVLDDPVDDHVDAVGGVEVRVRVLLGDAAVGGPAGVADAGGGRRRQHGDRSRGLVVARLDGDAQLREVADGADRRRGRPRPAW